MLIHSDGTTHTPNNDEELFYSLTNDLFTVLGLPPIVTGGTFQEAVLRMQEALILTTMLKHYRDQVTKGDGV